MVWRYVLGACLSAATVVLALSAPGLTGAALSAEPLRPGSAAPPWHAPASTVIDAQEMAFSNGSTPLSGTLYLPRGGSRLPAVVVTHGASSATRDLPLYRHLVEMLPPLGVAVFVYDRRGSGKSGGDLKASDYNLLADDAIAAQRMLARDPRIDAKRIGFWGLSQGGWLSLLAAARNPETAFAISVSAPMTTPDVQMNFATASILRIKGYGEDEIELALRARSAVDAHLRGEMDSATAQKALDAAVQRPWFDLIYMSKKLGDPKTSRWLKEMRHDPLKTLDGVKAPALVIYGSADPWVPVRLSMERLAATASKHPNIETAVIAGADHTMALSVDEKDQIDPAYFPHQVPEAPAYYGLIAAWLTRQGMTQAGHEQRAEGADATRGSRPQGQ